MLKKIVTFFVFFVLLLKTGYGQRFRYDDTLLSKIRIAATMIPGAMPTEIHRIKFAESPRTFAATVENGNKNEYIQARTAFQLIYPSSTIMIDAGMDKNVHSFFGKGKWQPYFESANDSIQLALSQASEILITHEHGDHIAGVLRSQNFSLLAPKTIVTYAQMHTLLTHPQMPELRMDSARLRKLIVVDFFDILPVAPGVVLIQAPGHTPGELMIYTKLANGKEYLFTGDVSWSYVGIEEKKQKPLQQSKRIGEDRISIHYQLEWLNELAQKGVHLIVSHDDIVAPKLEQQGLIKSGLILK